MISFPQSPHRLIFTISSSLITMATALILDIPPGFSISTFKDKGPVKELVNEVWQIVNRTYVDETFNNTDWQTIRQQLLQKDYRSKSQAYDAIRSALERLDDPYTRFFDPQEFSVIKQEAAGELSGVGARLSFNKTTKILTVTEVFENSPAATSRLKPGDRVLAVDGRSVQELDAFKTISLVRGKPGTQVKLAIARGQKQIVNLVLTRQVVQFSNISATVKQEGRLRIGYIRLMEFDDTVDQRVKVAIQTLEKQKIDGFVLDLRENPGGVVRVAANVSSYWLNRGTIVKTVVRNGDTSIAEADRNAITQLPLALLVNNGSASASEIVAGALKDNRRAIVVGTRTYGKGIVQQMHRLPDGSGLNVTVAHYFTPNGTDINHKGIVPDIIVPLNHTQSNTLIENPKLFASKSDPQYQRAVHGLLEKNPKMALRPSKDTNRSCPMNFNCFFPATLLN
jgi:carboxyl-terminal processing protease